MKSFSWLSDQTWTKNDGQPYPREKCVPFQYINIKKTILCYSVKSDLFYLVDSFIHLLNKCGQSLKKLNHKLDKPYQLFGFLISAIVFFSWHITVGGENRQQYLSEKTLEDENEKLSQKFGLLCY